MAKRKIKRVRSTVDLIVHHAHRHLRSRPHLRMWEHVAGWRQSASSLIFAFAGVCVLLTAFYIFNSGAGDPAFLARDATNYAAQESFYAGDEAVHAAAVQSAEAREAVHAAAEAVELAQLLNTLGVALIIVALWYLHREHGIFTGNRAGFRIRRIR